MREDSPLGRVAFWVVTALAVLWAVVGVAAIVAGVFVETGALWPILIAFGPITLVAVSVVVDRLRSPEDRRYSRDVHD